MMSKSPRLATVLHVGQKANGMTRRPRPSYIMTTFLLQSALAGSLYAYLLLTDATHPTYDLHTC